MQKENEDGEGDRYFLPTAILEMERAKQFLERAITEWNAAIMDKHSSASIDMTHALVNMEYTINNMRNRVVTSNDGRLRIKRGESI